MAHNVFRDQLTISSWLLLGASVQCSLVAIFGARIWIVGLPILVLVLRFVRAVLQVYGVLHNPHMDHVISGRTTCHFPSPDGSYSGSPADQSLAVLLITARSNHPFGLFAPGFRQAGEYFGKCVAWLEEDASSRGYLGSTQWLNSGDRKTSNHIMMVIYFRSTEDIHAFAHHAIHRAPWKWWNQSAKGLQHISLTHENFQTQKGAWENVFHNSSPIHLGTALVKGEDGMWRSPLIYVDSRHASSAKRMNHRQTTEEKQREEETQMLTEADAN